MMTRPGMPNIRPLMATFSTREPRKRNSIGASAPREAQSRKLKTESSITLLLASPIPRTATLVLR